MERIVKKIEATAAQLPKQMRVAAYARVSLGKEHMLHSLAAQVSHYNKLIQSKAEWEFAGVYADADETGTKSDRPEFQRLLADCRVGKIDMVIVKTISRLARNTVTLLETVRELKDLGIDIFFEEQNINSLSSEGELLLSILASYAQEESRSASENVKWRKRNDMKTGKTKPKKIYGYELVDGKLVINEEQAALVRQMYEWYLAGDGTPAIAKKLNTMGIPSPSGNKWASAAIHRILVNPKMCGDILHQRQFVTDHISKRLIKNRGELPMYLIEGTHEGIVSKEYHEKVLAEFARRAETGNMKDLEGLPFRQKLFCEKCGRKYNRKPNCLHGEMYGEWACWGRMSKLYDCNDAVIVRERTLILASEIVLGLEKFDGEVFAKNVERIIVHTSALHLTFVFHDGRRVVVSYRKFKPWREVKIIEESNSNPC